MSEKKIETKSPEIQDVPENKGEKIFQEKEELEGIIAGLEQASKHFQSQISAVFGDEKNMTEEQREKTNGITKQRKETIMELQKILRELGDAKYASIVKSGELSVYHQSSNRIDQKTGEEYRGLQNKISDLQQIMLELDESQEILLKEFRLRAQGEKINASLDKKTLEAMRTISITEFLKKPFDERLQYVTANNTHAEDVRSGKVADLEVNFSFNGRFNRALYMSTTAGMLLPDEVRTVRVDGELYSRSEHAQKGEFFTTEGKRLIIRDDTHIHVETLVKTSDLEKKYKSTLDLSQYKTPIEKEIALESEKRGLPPHFIGDAFQDELEQITDPKTKKSVLEDLFVEIDRKKGEFFSDFSLSPVDKNGKMTPRFLAYFLEGDQARYESVAKKNGYSSLEIQDGLGYLTTKSQYTGSLDLEKLVTPGITPADIARIRSIRRFEPRSKDTVMLFQIAAKVAGISESWATNPQLHSILERESNGKVGILNYTMKGMSLDAFRQKANSSVSANPFGVKSTASGLGQLLLSNVDQYYPSGRRGIGDPIEEAAGFMNYIKDRYGHPDVAWSVYGKLGSYTHAISGKRIVKGYKEGY